MLNTVARAIYFLYSEILIELNVVFILELCSLLLWLKLEEPKVLLTSRREAYNNLLARIKFLKNSLMEANYWYSLEKRLERYQGYLPTLRKCKCTIREFVTVLKQTRNDLCTDTGIRDGTQWFYSNSGRFLEGEEHFNRAAKAEVLLCWGQGSSDRLSSILSWTNTRKSAQRGKFGLLKNYSITFRDLPLSSF